MGAIGQSNFLAAETTVLSTQLNSLTLTTGKAITNALDNTSDKAIWAMLELFVGYAVAPTGAGTALEVYLLPSIDGTNYPEGSTTVDPMSNMLTGIIPIRLQTATQRLVVPRVLIPPGFYKYLLFNRANQATAASGNTLKERRWEMDAA